jgi:4-hydroxy-4-methyl-2-oxoglutarate aldolase
MGPDGEIIELLLELGAATLGESGARPMRPGIRRAWPGARLAAPAYPVRCTPGDNLAIHVAVTKAPEGSALVVDVGDLRDHGYWGEVLTTAAEARGIRGLVIDGGVRDVSALEAHGFPVFCSTIALRGASKEKPGAVNVPIRCGNAAVVRNDWVVGDADGVVVIGGADFHAVLEAAKAREEKEARMFQALKNGKTTMKLLGLDGGPVREGEA